VGGKKKKDKDQAKRHLKQGFRTLGAKMRGKETAFGSRKGRMGLTCGDRGLGDSAVPGKRKKLKTLTGCRGGLQREQAR